MFLVKRRPIEKWEEFNDKLYKEIWYKRTECQKLMEEKCDAEMAMHILRIYLWSKCRRPGRRRSTGNHFWRPPRWLGMPGLWSTKRYVWTPGRVESKNKCKKYSLLIWWDKTRLTSHKDKVAISPWMMYLYILTAFLKILTKEIYFYSSS